MDFPMEAYVQAHGQAYGKLGDAYTQAAALEAQGRQQMTEGLTKGLMGAFGEFKAGREAEKNFSAGRSMLESPYFQQMLGMKPDEAVDFGSYLDLIREKQGARTANNVMESALGNIMKYAQVSRQFENALAVQRLRNQGALDVAGMPARSSGRQVVPGTGFQLQDSTVNSD
jgi:hypothetical protein